MKTERYKQILFEVLEFLRKELNPKFYDWKDCDDYIFANLNLTKSELEQIYKDKDVMVYYGSAIDDV